MTKQEMSVEIASRLKETGARKHMKTERHTFYIRDNEGNTAEFEVKQKERSAMYTYDDVKTVLDCAIDVILNAIQRGDSINIKGLGVLRLHKRSARRSKQPGTDNWFDIEEHMVPKFLSGNRLKMAAKTYELLQKDKELSFNVPEPIYDEDDL